MLPAAGSQDVDELVGHILSLEGGVVKGLELPGIEHCKREGDVVPGAAPGDLGLEQHTQLVGRCHVREVEKEVRPVHLKW